MVVFIIGWGIAEYALLYPNSKITSRLPLDIIILPYFQMFGELYQQEIIKSTPYEMASPDEDPSSCTDNPELYSNFTKIRCPDKRTNMVVLVLLMIYLMVTNLLLFNIIISIFNKTFEIIQSIFKLLLIFVIREMLNVMLLM